MQFVGKCKYQKSFASYMQTTSRVQTVTKEDNEVFLTY